MEYTIQVDPICPFVNRKCITDGFVKHTPEGAVYRPCMYFDEYSSGEEPCLIKRAINKVLDIPDHPIDTTVEVPY